MFNSPIRRAQLIAPFGVGSLFMTKEGVSLIGAGLDHWFDDEFGGGGDLDTEEFYIEEWRLQISLGVDSFRLPPDFRRKTQFGPNTNTNLSIPFLRFPTWHFCQRCGRMVAYPLTERGQKKCACDMKGDMVQVPIVVICDHGHIQDFPWKEWVHKTQHSECEANLYFGSSGAGGLGGLTVTCRSCTKYRNLASVLSASPSGDDTYLSSNLDKTQLYLCDGRTPWLGDQLRQGCGRPLRGALRSSTNIYYAQQASAIYLPRTGHNADPDLIDLMTQPPISQVRQLFGDGITCSLLRGSEKCAKLIVNYDDQQVDEALAIAGGQYQNGDGDIVEGDDPHTAFRRREFNALLQLRRDEQLVVTPADLNEYEPIVADYFSAVNLAEKVRETRALRGFTRVFPENDMDDEVLQNLMRSQPPEEGERWLPAHVVFGEGVFLRLNEERLQVWESRPDIVSRVRPLVERYRAIQEIRHLRDRAISPRFILAHTLAHLLINRLTFESGYSAASLRERLFVSDDEEYPMAGILIYTAAGDSEGTMGGLVRLGKPGFFEPIFRKAIEEAKWCGADPVCMETGDMGGQGPDSSNIAACHNCALIPETACEEFNRFLDRGLVVGSLSSPEIGLFSNY